MAEKEKKGEEEKKEEEERKPYIEIRHAADSPRGWSWSQKKGPFVPVLYARYIDEEGIPHDIKGKDDNGDMYYIQSVGGSKKLEGMANIANFLRKTVPTLISTGMLPSNLSYKGIYETIPEDVRNSLPDSAKEGLNELKPAFPMSREKKQEREDLYKKYKNRNVAMALRSIPGDPEGLEKAFRSAIYDLDTAVNSLNTALGSNDYLTALGALGGLGFAYSPSASQWSYMGDPLPAGDVLFNKRLEELGLPPNLLMRIEQPMNAGDVINSYKDKLAMEKVLSERLTDAVETGNFNLLYGPWEPNNVSFINVKDKPDLVENPILEEVEPDALLRRAKRQRMGIDLLDTNSDFMQNMIGEPGFEEAWNKRAQQYIDNAIRHKIQFIGPTGKKSSTTFTYISPRDLAEMGENYIVNAVDRGYTPELESFPGLSEISGGPNYLALENIQKIYDDYYAQKGETSPLMAAIAERNRLRDKESAENVQKHNESVEKIEKKAYDRKHPLAFNKKTRTDYRKFVARILDPEYNPNAVLLTDEQRADMDRLLKEVPEFGRLWLEGKAANADVLEIRDKVFNAILVYYGKMMGLQ